MTNTTDYRTGSIITYTPFGGGPRTVRVDARVPQIKNGEDGFDGVTGDGLSVWGYDHQIVTVEVF